MSAISPREQREIARANQSGAEPVVFVHGLWLLASSWDRWRELFEGSGYATLAPRWPDDPETIDEARQHPEVFANKRLEQLTERFAEVIRQLRTKPAIVGHSFGGLITQRPAGMGLASGSGGTRGSPSSARFPTAGTRSPSTAGGGRSPSSRWRS